MGEDESPRLTAKELAAAIRRVAKLHQQVAGAGAGGKVSSADVIELLRQQGQQEEADELERLVALLKSRETAAE